MSLVFSATIYLFTILFFGNFLTTDCINNKLRANFTDLMKGLSDAEIEIALSDLTYTDLDVLSQLLDTSNPIEDDSDDRRSQNNLRQEKETPSSGNIRDDTVSKPAKINEMNGPHLWNQRSKREYKNHKQYLLNAEYIKDLENSFPHCQDQNNNEDNEDKKEHIRVKRNKIKHKIKKIKL
ncbi:uncharacterized protein LOC119687749 isoform X2 [Teleopsis dalmanni]|uniref:uncharacterized protein LOC119687749 isoform X2 n=1 Tax=Teleopsis dalmanni TaxID=139649 RepID=UPI0018CF0AC3|nr:uncharacterized protein LOC119687749 isoform X2 [Teleopsis dalmanni]